MVGASWARRRGITRVARPYWTPSSSLAIRHRLYAAPTRRAAASVLCLPFTRVLRKLPTVFP